MRFTLSFSTKIFLIIAIFQFSIINAQQKFSKRQIQKIKLETVDLVQNRFKQTQVMIDKVFSFAELGHQEFETSKYLTGILESAGFEVEYGISGSTSIR